MTKIEQIQEILGVTSDGKWGRHSQAALDALIQHPAPQVSPAVETPESGPPVDERSEGNIASLHPKVQPLARQLIQTAVAQGMQFKITSGLRTYAEQNALYEQGRSKPGKRVTNVRGGFSSHNFATAFDVTLFDGKNPVWESPKYKALGALGKSMGLSWGGDWTNPKDEPHFYLKPGWAKSMSESQMMAELRRRHDRNIDAFA